MPRTPVNTYVTAFIEDTSIPVMDCVNPMLATDYRKLKKVIKHLNKEHDRRINAEEENIPKLFKNKYFEIYTDSKPLGKYSKQPENFISLAYQIDYIYDSFVSDYISQEEFGAMIDSVLN